MKTKLFESIVFKILCGELVVDANDTVNDRVFYELYGVFGIAGSRLAFTTSSSFHLNKSSIVKVCRNE